MKSVSRRLLFAIVALVVLLLGLAGLALFPGDLAGPSPSAAGASPAAEPRLLTEAQDETFRFFNDGRAASGSGRGLFETDFFKPPPAPPPAPKPAPPTTRELVLFYRGFAAFPDGSRVAYVSVEGRTATLNEGEAVTDGWKLVAFDSEQAALAKGEEKVTLLFNRRATVSVPVKP